MKAWLHPHVRGLLGRRWTLAMLDLIERGEATRPAHLQKRLGMRHRIVYQRLAAMTDAGWLERLDNRTYPRHVTYRLRHADRWRPPLEDWRRLGLDWSLATIMLGHRWMPTLLFATGMQPCCFQTLKALMPGIADKVLAEHLAMLQDAGLLAQGGRDGKSWLQTPKGACAFSAVSLLAVVAAGESVAREWHARAPSEQRKGMSP